MINEDYVVETFKEGDITLDVKVDYNSKIIWLSQKDMAVLLGVSSDNIGLHIKNITPSLSINNAFIGPITKDYSVVQTEGYRSVNRKIKHYNLDIILAVGYRCNPKITTVFKAWVGKLFNNYEQLENKEKQLNEANPYEIMQFKDGEFMLDVEVSPKEDTVWLTKDQISELYERDRSVISKHIKNIFDENECSYSSNVQKMHIANSTKPVEVYNLDVILSVGYRVKSKRGNMFRKWANSILGQYLLKGYSINNKRCLEHSDILFKLLEDFNKLNDKLEKIENTLYGADEQLIYEGDLIKPFEFLRKLFFLAKKEIIIIDNYADRFLLSLLDDIKVNITIICNDNSYINRINLKNNIKITKFKEIHDRYIIVDNNVYTIGTSINSIGKSRFAIIKLHIITKEMILKKFGQD